MKGLFAPGTLCVLALILPVPAQAQLPLTKAPGGAPPETQAVWSLISRGMVNTFPFSELRITIAFSITTESGALVQAGTYDSDSDNSGIKSELLPIVESMRRPVTAPFYGPDNFGSIRQTEVNDRGADCFAYDRNMKNFNRDRSARIDKGDVCYERDRGVVLRHAHEDLPSSVNVVSDLSTVALRLAFNGFHPQWEFPPSENRIQE